LSRLRSHRGSGEAADLGHTDNRANLGLDLATIPAYASSDKYMQRKPLLLTTLVLLVAVGFLAAQFHFCADLTAGPSGSHLCPLCSTAGAAIVSSSVSVATPVSIAKPLETLVIAFAVSAELSPSLSPRAPPSL
jgi:hypothetical protein